VARIAAPAGKGQAVSAVAEKKRGGTNNALEVDANRTSPPDMIDRLDQDASFNLLRNALGVRTHRQEVLASNIANADTPHYKARDVDFRAALQTALGGRGVPAAQPVTLARTQAGHLAGSGLAPHAGAIGYRAEYQGAVDGNTVNMDIERAALAENTIQLEALLTFINRRFEGMQRALQSQ
jgi:flagellar basal-body rod protein FlgB